MRGEYLGGFSVMGNRTELPPHARRIQPMTCVNSLPLGTTSACAENTCGGWNIPRRYRNYLRMRGEYLGNSKVLSKNGGTTSACAENTGQSWSWLGRHRNYLRMRGEYITSVYMIEYGMELPPHARRIHLLASRAASASGTTSACAENTASFPYCQTNARNYLRMRGEYTFSPSSSA